MKLWEYLVVTLLFLKSSAFKNESSDNGQETLVYKGFGAQIHEYSYAVFLHFDSTRPSSCGASLIMVQAVLTAAHCVDEMRYKRGKIHAYFGATVPRNAIVVRQVIDYQINPNYDEVKGRNNLAVAFLANRVPLRHDIKKIALVAKDPPVDTEGFSVGWGKQFFGKLPDISKYRTLKGSKQKVLSRRECTYHAGFVVSPGALCTSPIVGHNYKDDSGNGFIVKGHSQLLVGVLSFVANDINIYTSVLRHRDWIINTCRNLYEKNCRGKGK